MKCQGKTHTDFLDKHLYLFKDKDVLEIGPGEGRQMKKIEKYKTYTVADISPAVIERHGGYLMKNYNDDMKKTFDIIHFWFVVHHVRRKEVKEFFAFVNRHLREDGMVMFNYPVNWGKKDDGMSTTKHDLKFNYTEIEPYKNGKAVLIGGPVCFNV